MPERFETFTVLAARLSRSIKRIKSEQMARFRLRGAHVSCLYYLAQFGPMTAAELCERADEDKAAVSRSVEQLEQEGYLSCGDGGGRRYRALLRLSKKGLETGELIRQKIDGIVEQASAGIGEQERAVMYRALERICENLERLAQTEEKRA